MSKHIFNVILLLILVVLVVGLGCGLESSGPTPTTTSKQVTVAPTPSASAKPTASPSPVARKPEGSLTIAVGDLDQEYWLPHRSGGATMQFAAPMYEYLIDRDPQTRKYIPWLATSWTNSPDGLTWTFDLKQGVQFHDGWGEFTADDVKFSIEFLTRKDSTSAVKQYVGNTFSEIKVLDKYKVQFTLKQPSLDLEMYLSEIIPYIPMISKKYIESVGVDVDKANAHPIATGPYKFVENVTADHLTYQALDQHWRQVAYYKTLTFKVIPEEATRIAMLKTGETDIAAISMPFMNDVIKAGMTVKSVPGALNYYLGFGGLYLPSNKNFNPKIPWVGDPNDKASMDRALKVRQALSLAIDKNSLVANILKGKGKPSVSFVVWDWMGSYDPAWKPTEYNPELAKKLMTEAGYGSGFELSMLHWDPVGQPSNSNLAEAVAMMWEKNLGVKTKFITTDWASTRPKAVARDLGGIIIPYARKTYDNPGSVLGLISYSKGSMILGWEDPNTDQLLDQYNKTFDQSKADLIQRQIIQYEIDNQLTIPLAYEDFIIALNPKKVADWQLVSASERMVNFESIRPPAK